MEEYNANNGSAPKPTETVLDHLFSGHAGYIGMFSGLRPEPDPDAKLEDVSSVFFRYPEERTKSHNWALEESKRGRESYYCAHLLTAKRRTKDNAAHVRALWADGDGAKPDDLPQPTMVVSSSPGREQYVWRLSRPIAPERAENLNQRIAYAMGADKSGWDLTQVLRLPGTKNHKYADTPTVQLKRITAEEYDPEYLDSILPALPDKPNSDNKDAVGFVAPVPPPDVTLNDVLSWLLIKAKNAHKIGKLMYGPPDLKRRSEDDLALADYVVFYTGGNIDLAEQVMRRSVRVRDKWDEPRTKDGTWIRGRIKKAIADTSEFYHWPGFEAAPESVGPFGGIYSAADLENADLPEPKWAAPGLLPEGLTVMAGKGKIGKSWLALHLALAVASGGKVLSRADVERGDVLYLALEDNARRMKDRIKELKASFPERLQIVHNWPTRDDGGLQRIEDWLKDRPDARMVIIDVLARFKGPPRGRNRNAYEIDYAEIAPVQKLAKKYGVAIVLVHHLRKSDAEDPLDLISGSLGQVGPADAVWILRRKRGETEGALFVNGRDIKEDRDYAVSFKDALWAITGDDASKVNASKERKATIEVFENAAPKSLTARDVDAVLNHGYHTVRKRLLKMANEGTLISQMVGNTTFYRLASLNTQHV